MTEKKQAILSEKGFTLLEMIVAVTLVAMMAAGIWSIFRTGIRSWSRGTELIDAGQRHRNILDMVHKQLASAYPLAAPADQGSTGASYPIFTGTETGFSFVSLNSLNFQDSPGLTLVNYSVIQDPQGAYSLMESEERYLGKLPDSENSGNPSSAIPLFENLTECSFEYRSEDTTDNSDPWVREWNAQERQKLPVAISMTMVSTDSGGNTRNRNIFVPIHATGGNTQTNVLNLAGLRGGRGIGRGGGISSEIEEAMRRGIEQFGPDPRIDMGMGPGRGQGRGQGRGPGGEPGRGPGRGQGRGQGRGPGGEPGMGPGMGPGGGPGMGPGRGQGE